MHDWTSGLNPEQREAVLHTKGPLLILAGAGSGKTTVLVSRTGHILQSQKIRPSEICVLTFTTKAARELKHRVALKVGPKGKELWTGTFHSFGLKILRKYHSAANLPSGFGVIDQGDSIEIIKELLSNIRSSGKEAFKADKLFSIMTEWRSNGRKTARNPEDEYEVMVQVLLPKYLKKLELLGVVDFEGLLLKPLELFKENAKVLMEVRSQFKHVMVDEFQDTNVTQFRLVQALVDEHRNIAVVGDDDQSIYGWRGACVSNILDFPSHYPGCRVIRLERNYRSTPAIISIANEVISKNTARHGKVLRSDPDAQHGELPEVFVFDNDDVESEEVASQIRFFLDQGYKASDVAVLYRSNGQGGMIEAQLRKSQIPYSITGGTGFFDRKETKDALAYLRCSISPNEIAFRRIINAPTRGIGETTIEKIEKFGQEHGLKFHVASRKWREAGVQANIGEHVEGLFQTLDQFPEFLLHANPDKTVGENLLTRLHEMGYRDYIRQTCKDDMTVQKRWTVLEIFGRVLDAFVDRGGRTMDTLMEFVDAMELRDAGDDEEKDQTPKVQLLTLHACKGLEFPVVIFVGCEEELIPHRTLGSDVAEERRLFYVGVTRAKERLVLTRARTRKRFGKFVPAAPSRFLLEIPEKMLANFETGFRPVGEDQRKNMMADLFAKLANNAAKQKIT
jgi:DNA helicase II / ATP-dependent DNA helicase PcrA